MSYDIYLQGGSYEPHLPNPTYNLTPIFDLALTGEMMPNSDVSEGSVVLLGAKTDRPRGLRLLSGQRASETITMIEKALTRLRDPALHSQFAALEPSNGWGDLEGAVRVMVQLLDAAIEHPENTWEIH